MHINEEKLSLSLLGIGQFDNNVVYAKVISKSLYDLQKRLMVELKKENINIRGYYLLVLFVFCSKFFHFLTAYTFFFIRACFVLDLLLI